MKLKLKMLKAVNLINLSTLVKKWDFWLAIAIIITCFTCAALEKPKSFGADGWLVIGIVGMLFIVLIKDYIPCDFAMLLCLAALMFFQVVTTSEALAGFSNNAVLSVAILYVVAGGLTATGALDYIMNQILGKPTSIARAQLRMMVPVSIISAFMNNTPVVAIMIPIIQQWAAKANLPVSQLMIPLSFATVLGGTCTLIGTSTNLVVAGKAKEDADYDIGLFDLGIVGIPTLAWGLLYIVIFAQVLLPDAEEIAKRQNKAILSASANGKDANGSTSSTVYAKTDKQYSNFTVSCFVKNTSSIVGKTVSHLRGLSGLYLTSVLRQEQLSQAVGPEFVIDANDILFFTGVVDNFPKICSEFGFTPVTTDNEDSLTSVWRNAPTHIHPSLEHHKKSLSSDAMQRQDPLSLKLQKYESTPNVRHEDLLESDPSVAAGEVVPTNRLRAGTFESHLHRVRVSKNSSLVGKTPKDSKFRRAYKAAILSISRAGTKVNTQGGMGQFILASGDELLILTGDGFDFNNEITKRDLEDSPSSPGSIEFGTGSLDREYLISMKVNPSSRLIGTKSLVGLSIEQAGLRGLPGLFLIALERLDAAGNRQVFKHAVGREEILEKNDILWFVGERDALPTLRRIPGLGSPNQDQVVKLNFKKVERRLVECVISMNSDMIGKTIREVKFRSVFRAAVIGVHRQGHRVMKKIGDIKLKAGDVLLLETGPYFMQRFRDDPNFLLVAEIENSESPQFGKFYVALGCVIGMMFVYTFFQQYQPKHVTIVISLFECAVAASAIMVYFNIITPERARKSVNWDVVVTVACAFGLSTALENTKVAATIGDGLVTLADTTGTGEIGIITAVYLATFLLSIIIANNAAAVLMFPIAIRAVDIEDTDSFQRILFVLMLAASSCFATPFGYQTNLMVYGPGNYVFTDFLKFGLPMQFWQMVGSVLFVYYDDYWYVSWAISILALVFYVFFQQFKARLGFTPFSIETSKDPVVVGKELNLS